MSTTHKQTPTPDFSALMLITLIVVFFCGLCNRAEAQTNLLDLDTALVVPEYTTRTVDGFTTIPDWGYFYAVKYYTDSGRVVKIECFYDAYATGIHEALIETYCPNCICMGAGHNGSWYFDPETGSDVTIYPADGLLVIAPK